MSISYECGEANVVKHRSRILFRRYFENTASVAVATLFLNGKRLRPAAAISTALSPLEHAPTQRGKCHRG
jgi:hypothetical protein